jgi:hypothetical protein
MGPRDQPGTRRPKGTACPELLHDAGRTTGTR